MRRGDKMNINNINHIAAVAIAIIVVAVIITLTILLVDNTGTNATYVKAYPFPEQEGCVEITDNTFALPGIYCLEPVEPSPTPQNEGNGNGNG